jgi:membrane glycosyltransferase
MGLLMGETGDYQFPLWDLGKEESFINCLVLLAATILLPFGAKIWSLYMIPAKQNMLKKWGICRDKVFL